MPARVAAQVMNIGDYDDVEALARQVGDQYLRDVLEHAEIGLFSERSWVYWHDRLGLAAPGRAATSVAGTASYTVLVPWGPSQEQHVTIRKLQRTASYRWRW